MSVAQIDKFVKSRREPLKFLKVADVPDLSRLENFLQEIPAYADFKIIRSKSGKLTYLLGNGYIKSRNRGRNSMLRRPPFLKAHASICFETDELEERGFHIIDGFCTREVCTNAEA